jgi:hypothetical protein
VSKGVEKRQARAQKSPDQRGFGGALGHSGHENGNKGQQKNQHTPGNGQHDGHQGNNALHHILFFGVVVFGVVVGSRHGVSKGVKVVGILSHGPRRHHAQHFIPIGLQFFLTNTADVL